MDILVYSIHSIYKMCSKHRT